MISYCSITLSLVKLILIWYCFLDYTIITLSRFSILVFGDALKGNGIDHIMVLTDDR